MKQILKNKIINIVESDKFDNKFNFSVLNYKKGQNNIEVIYISDLLEEKKNLEIFEKAQIKFASYSNVYSPEDELDIFKNIFDNAIKNNKKIHIVWITLKDEIDIIEDYYRQLWFFNDDMNCFDVDFSKVLISVSVKIENLMWRWSDYRRMWKEIFFNPPIRESGQVKAMFKWINRWSIAWVKFSELNLSIIDFFQKQVLEENIIAINLAKVLYFNLIDFWLKWEKLEIIIEY